MPSDRALYTYVGYGTYFLARGEDIVTKGGPNLSDEFLQDYKVEGFSSLAHSKMKYVLPLELML